MLPKIEIRVDEVGRGVFLLDGTPIPGVVAARVDIHPSQEFTACSFTVVGSFEAEIFLHDKNLSVAVLDAPAVAGDDPEPLPFDLLD